MGRNGTACVVDKMSEKAENSEEHLSVWCVCVCVCACVRACVLVYMHVHLENCNFFNNIEKLQVCVMRYI